MTVDCTLLDNVHCHVTPLGVTWSYQVGSNNSEGQTLNSKRADWCLIGI